MRCQVSGDKISCTLSSAYCLQGSGSTHLKRSSFPLRVSSEHSMYKKLLLLRTNCTVTTTENLEPKWAPNCPDTTTQNLEQKRCVFLWGTVPKFPYTTAQDQVQKLPAILLTIKNKLQAASSKLQIWRIKFVDLPTAQIELQMPSGPPCALGPSKHWEPALSGHR